MPDNREVLDPFKTKVVNEVTSITVKPEYKDYVHVEYNHSKLNIVDGPKFDKQVLVSSIRDVVEGNAKLTLDDKTKLSLAFGLPTDVYGRGRRIESYDLGSQAEIIETIKQNPSLAGND